MRALIACPLRALRETFLWIKEGTDSICAMWAVALAVRFYAFVFDFEMRYFASLTPLFRTSCIYNKGR